MRSQVMIQNVENYKLLTYGLSHVQATDQWFKNVGVQLHIILKKLVRRILKDMVKWNF